eukprot:CAMPEP_0115081962 /NCGR_PEP_ID=MMETSP0227-20121206/19602_1 /TAXON_ID=89957 /ORGANISM="Polarella glacialis, Strain CCMP 1383" /LENGTH=150 /DNA_ID=CAMNT_0002469929 /DNA_START=131 /DNA_END=580 /DNA_ORIENTATION=+
MAVVGEACHSLTPFGVGATLEQLGTGGFMAGKPLRPRLVHGMGLTSDFAASEFVGGGSRGASALANGRGLTGSRSAPSLTWSGQIFTETQPWHWDELRAPRTPVREREVSRLSKILGSSTLSGVPGKTPLGVTQSAYYRRTGAVHGDPRW